jgi:hypothetical protein
MLESKTISNDIELAELLAEADRREAAKDCVFFIDHYLKTFDPRPESYPHDLDFHTYDFQRELVQELLDAMENGTDLFLEKSRDMGASWTVLAVILWGWLFLPGFQALIGSRKEEYVDKPGDMKTLFQKLDYMISKIKDPLLLPEGYDVKKHRTYMKLLNPANGNAVVGESSNTNFGRGGRFRIVLFDELGFWPDDRSAWQASSESTHCRVAITTPPDHPTWTKVHRFSGKVRVLTYHWRRHPAKDNAWYAYEKSRKTEEEVLHELDISWEYSSTGRPYPEISKVPIGQYPYQKAMPLYVSMDLGLDALALGWYQPQQNSNWITLLEAFESSDHIIEWYFPFIGLGDCVNVDECPWCEKQHHFEYTDKEIEFAERVSNWPISVFFGDPSGKQRHIESGISPYAILEAHGIEVHVNEIENDWVSRRDATKRLLPTIAVNDTERTRWWVECIKNSHYPKRDENSQAVNAVAKPVHDWTSHHRTQTEFFSVNYKDSEYEVRPAGIAEAPIPVAPTKETPYEGQSDGTIEGVHVDIEAILREQTTLGRDWRSM